jgi:hypothetical protein
MNLVLPLKTPLVSITKAILSMIFREALAVL